MPTNYPGSLDNLPRPTSTTNMDDAGFEGDVVIDNLSDAVEAVEAELGTTPSGSFATVKERLDFSEPVLVLDDGEAVPAATPVNTVILRRTATGGGGDHNALQNLTVGNPHTQYALATRKTTLTQSTYWQQSPQLGSPTGTVWPIINRAYYAPFLFSSPVTITAMVMSQTASADTGNVLRLGIYEDSGSGTPGVVVDQTTVAADTIGAKIWTFATAKTFTSGVFWLAVAPQGTGAPGSAWMTAIDQGSMPTHQSSASPNFASAADFPTRCQYSSASGAFGDNPSVANDSSYSRFPFCLVRMQ